MTDGGEEAIVAIRGRRDDAVTAGFICSKVARFAQRVTHRDRLLHPMRRVGEKGTGQFRRISWDEAIDGITTRFREIATEWGGEAILPYHYGGSNGVLTDGFHDDLYFACLGSSRLEKTLCAAPSTAVAVGMYGKMPGVAFEDYAHAKCIVVWGANPKASNIHLMPFLKQAKAKGAFLAVVDPVRNFSANEADLHLPVRPGTDLPMALAMIKLWRDSGRLDGPFVSRYTKAVQPLLEAADKWPVDRAAAETGLRQEDLCRLAEVYAASTPALIRCGWGLERNKNGGQAIAAILSMPALLGKFGARGGGYTLSNSGAAELDVGRLFDLSGWGARIVNMTQLGEVLNGDLDPPIKGLFVYNCNPAVTVPDQNSVLRGLAREDLFTVVFDQVMTDTTAYADMLLPATTFLEHRDVRISYGSYTVGGVRPVIAPRGEARPSSEVFAALGRAMGFSDEALGWDSETSVRRLAGALKLHGGPTDAEALIDGMPQRYPFSGRTPVQFETVFPLTSDGLVNLCPVELGEAPYTYCPVRSGDFPLALVSPATSKMITSTLGEFNFGDLWVLVHPDDAADRGIVTGHRVRVFNELGEVVCVARVSEKIRPGVVSMPKGAWRKSSGNGMTATALCPAHVNDVGGGACFNDARVEMERVSREW